MFQWRAFFTVMLVGMAACCCGGPEDRKGASLTVGEQYLMTGDGLEHVPFMKDRLGNRVEVGKEYRMTGDGLELVTHLRDASGKRVEIGYDYFMAEEGLRPVRSRMVRGILVDAAGNPLSGFALAMEGTPFKTVCEGDGAFRFPFIEGPVKLVLESAELPGWCQVEQIADGYLHREEQPDGWNLGPVAIPCTLGSVGGGKKAWITPDGEFADNGDGTVSDRQRHLMWEAEIQEVASLDQAREYTESLGLAGHSDWRLPTVEELKNLSDSGRACAWHGPALIRGGLTVWALDSSQETVVVNLCSGGARKTSGAESGPIPSPGVVSVRAAQP